MQNVLYYKSLWVQYIPLNYKMQPYNTNSIFYQTCQKLGDYTVDPYKEKDQ